MKSASGGTAGGIQGIIYYQFNVIQRVTLSHHMGTNLFGKFQPKLLLQNNADTDGLNFVMNTKLNMYTI
jgi:hypothetical protein